MQIQLTLSESIFFSRCLLNILHTIVNCILCLAYAIPKSLACNSVRFRRALYILILLNHSRYSINSELLN